jgi:hypothetical protein
MLDRRVTVELDGHVLMRGKQVERASYFAAIPNERAELLSRPR